MTIEALFGSRIADIVPGAITPALAAELRARVASRYTRYALLDRASYEHAPIDEPALFARIAEIVEERLAIEGASAMQVSASGASATRDASATGGARVTHDASATSGVRASAMELSAGGVRASAMELGAGGVRASAMELRGGGGGASATSGEGTASGGSATSGEGPRSIVEARVLRFAPGDYLLAHADRVYEGNPIELVVDLSEAAVPGAEVHYRRRGAVFFRVPSQPCSMAIVERGPTVTCNHTYVSKRNTSSVVRLVALLR